LQCRSEKKCSTGYQVSSIADHGCAISLSSFINPDYAVLHPGYRGLLILKTINLLALGGLRASAREQDHCTTLYINPDYAALHPGYRGCY
jgi:hypothetical protein